MVSVNEQALLLVSDLVKEEEESKKRYRDKIVSHFKNNSAFARTCRLQVDYVSRLQVGKDFDSDIRVFREQFTKRLGLATVSVALMKKVLIELYKSKDFSSDSLLWLGELCYNRDFFIHNCVRAYSDFVVVLNEINLKPNSLFKKKIVCDLEGLRLKELGLMEIYLDIFEGTNVFSGVVKTEEPEFSEEI